MSSTAAVVCMTSSTRTMERVFVASARSEASQGVLIGRKAAARRVETRHVQAGASACTCSAEVALPNSPSCRDPPADLTAQVELLTKMAAQLEPADAWEPSKAAVAFARLKALQGELAAL